MAGEPAQTQGSTLWEAVSGDSLSPGWLAHLRFPFVGGILDVVTDVVEHPMSSGTVRASNTCKEYNVGMIAPSSPFSPAQGSPDCRSTQSPILAAAP